MLAIMYAGYIEYIDVLVYVFEVGILGANSRVELVFIF